MIQNQQVKDNSEKLRANSEKAKSTSLNRGLSIQTVKKRRSVRHGRRGKSENGAKVGEANFGSSALLNSAAREAPFAFNNPAAAEAMSDITLLAHRVQLVKKVHLDLFDKLQMRISYAYPHFALCNTLYVELY